MLAQIISICLIIIAYLTMRPAAIRGGLSYGGAMRPFVLPLKLEDARNIVDNPLVDPLIVGASTLLTFDQIPHRMPYATAKYLPKVNTHNGQVKLFLTELEFLTNVPDDPAVCIYAGSAPSNKISYLNELFPKIKWVLVDPNEHYIQYGKQDQYDPIHIDKMLYFVAAGARGKSPGASMSAAHKRGGNQLINMYTDGRPMHTARRATLAGSIPADICDVINSTDYQYYIIEDFMTDHIAKLLSKLPVVYFISDIRSRDEDEESPSELDILWNSAMMFNWLSILRPRKFMLKFRCPYAPISPASKEAVRRDLAKNTYMQAALKSCSINFIENYMQDKFVYIKPETIYLQAFAGPSSTESRLVGSSLDLIEYDIYDYEEKFFYYNRMHRAWGWHSNCTDRKLGVDHCGDCAIMCKLFELYQLTRKLPIRPESMIHRLTKTIGRDFITHDAHGLYYQQYPDRASLINNQQYIIDVHIARQFAKIDIKSRTYSEKEIKERSIIRPINVDANMSNTADARSTLIKDMFGVGEWYNSLKPCIEIAEPIMKVEAITAFITEYIRKNSINSVAEICRIESEAVNYKSADVRAVYSARPFEFPRGDLLIYRLAGSGAGMRIVMCEFLAKKYRHVIAISAPLGLNTGFDDAQLVGNMLVKVMAGT